MAVVTRVVNPALFPALVDKYYVCDSDGEKPTSGLHAGFDICYV